MLIGDEIYLRLSSTYTLSPEDFIAPRLRNVSLFEFIIAVMLSQNTNDNNAWRAYNNLKKKLDVITPEAVLNMDFDSLVESIRVAGMYIIRGAKMRELAEHFIKSDIEKRILEYIERGDLRNARQELIKLPGIGDKTADVVLLMYYNQSLFPIDTHIARITKRLGFVKSSKYKDISSFWMENTSPQYYLPLHLLLITHGRRTCKARKPLCSSCVLKDICAYFKGSNS